jgi:hypothetical protein
MSYNLKTKYRDIFSQLSAVRMGNPAQNIAPRDVSLREFLREYFPLGENDTNEPVDVFFHELGINRYSTRAVELFRQKDGVGEEGMGEIVAEYVRDGIRTGMGLKYRDMVRQMRDRMEQQFAITAEGPEGQRWVSPEVFLPPAIRAMVQAAYYQLLIIEETTVAQLTVTAPRIELSDASPTRGRTQGATRTVGIVTYDNKQVKIHEFSKGIEVTNEAMWFNTIDFLSIFFRQLGSLLAADLNNECVFVLVNGDQAIIDPNDDSEAAAVIGVDDPTIGFQYKDILRASLRESTMAAKLTSLIGNEETLLDYMDLPEVKGTQLRGDPLLKTNLNTPAPTELDAFASIEVDDDQIALEDNSQSLIQLTAKPLMIESERSIKKGLNGSYASVFTGFANVLRHTRIVIDRTLAFSAHGFPDWMDAYRGQRIGS